MVNLPNSDYVAGSNRPERPERRQSVTPNLTGSLENRLINFADKFADNPVSVIEFPLTDHNLNLAALIHDLHIRDSDYINLKGSDGRYQVQIFLFGADTQGALNVYAKLAEKIKKITKPEGETVHITTYKEGIKSFLNDNETLYMDEIAANSSMLTSNYKNVVLTRKVLSEKEAVDLVMQLKQKHPWLLDTLIKVAGLMEIPYLAKDDSGIIKLENDGQDAGSRETAASYSLLRPRISDSLYLKPMMPNTADNQAVKKIEHEYAGR